MPVLLNPAPDRAPSASVAVPALFHHHDANLVGCVGTVRVVDRDAGERLDRGRIGGGLTGLRAGEE